MNFETMGRDMNPVFSMSVNIRRVDSGDPLAFVAGPARGQGMLREREVARRDGAEQRGYDPKRLYGCLFSELAPEFLRGVKLGFTGLLLPEGTRIFKGTELTLIGWDEALATGREALDMALGRPPAGGVRRAKPDSVNRSLS